MKLVLLGAAVGGLLALLQRHPRRSLGLVTLGLLSLFSALSWAWGTSSLPLFWLSFSGTWIAVPLLTISRGRRANAWAALSLIVMATVVGVLIVLPRQSSGWTEWNSILVGWALSGLSYLFCCWLLFAHTLELAMEIFCLPLYRIRSHGPGRGKIPQHGPLILIANHSCYLDPFLLGKIIPRHFTPMMTSVFYDLPVVRWFMRKVVRAIRVEATGFRREAPELEEAKTVLREGGCVLIFPEAILRRSEDQILRKFGQGIWHVLQDLPDTPVIACWIEGGWGSFFSYKNGPPTKNKSPDFWHRIDIVVSDSMLIGETIRADHQTTRTYLMEQCLGLRQELDLPTNAPEG